jgi:hypothetical protein
VKFGRFGDETKLGWDKIRMRQKGDVSREGTVGDQGGLGNEVLTMGEGFFFIFF